MTRIVYVNGRYCPYDEALVHVQDRGFQFADAVYEVCEVVGGRLIDERLHMERLRRSMRELRMEWPVSSRALGVILRETVRRNRVRDGLVYLQVSRGAAVRDFAFPAPEVEPTVICYARMKSARAAEKRAAAGIRVVTMPDIRWKRVDIKSVALLPNALARQQAYDAGAQEAWMVDEDGFVTEGASCNAWILAEDGALITRPAETGILRGVTRTVLMEAIRDGGIAIVERPFSIEEAKSAKEAFTTSATGNVMPVVAVDGVTIGEGRPGVLTVRLRQLFRARAEKSDPRRLLA